jgi:hypothetical protein
VFDRFSLPDLARVSRRTMLAALVAGFTGLIVLMLLNQPWAGLGLCVGLALGISNFRLVQRSVVRVGERMPANKRRPLAMNTMGRMAVITAIALGVLFVLPPFGFGLLGGLALFQFLLLGNVTRSMLAMGAAPAAGSAGGTAVEDRPAVEVPDDGWGAG